MAQNAGLIIFAKAPVAGSVKTRLVPAIGLQQATELYKKLILHCFNSVILPSSDYQAELWCSPDTSHEFFHHLFSRYEVELYLQEGVDLGERMANAFKDVLKRKRLAIIIGTDCPLLDAVIIEQLFDKLEKHDAVVIPADDGGYVLLGLKKFDASLFSGLQWGSNNVLQQTREKLEKLQWSYYEHETFWDVDRPEDLEKLKSINLPQKLIT